MNAETAAITTFAAQLKNKNMKKVVLTYGVISGAIVSIWMLSSIAMGCDQMDNNWAMFLGFASMFIAYSFIFVAVKSFRDKFNNGTITFGKAFQIGLYISLIASTFYVVSWLIDYYLFIPDFMEKYASHTIEKLKDSGATAAEIASQTKEMASMKEMYKNPIMVILFTYMEILPVGLLISLVTALFLKRKPTQ